MTCLRSIIEAARTEAGGTLKDFTVLSTQVDPYRLDTPANHAVGKWFAEQIERLNLLHKRLHLRGIHYALLGSTAKPSREAYSNTHEDWIWLQADASKAARWLGYIPFEAITDARNEAPITYQHEEPSVSSYVSVEPHIVLPEVSAIEPRAGVFITTRQPYRLALYGEKSSLEPILGPIARAHGADLFLPTGEISDTQLHTMALEASQDCRKLIVFTVTDFDPAGWQMAVSIGRKLQALKDLLFPDLEFELRPIGLSGEQARKLDLPSTPLKESERRAGKWRESMGWEQTEIDALATLQPGVLRQILEDALEPFYDYTLNMRRLQAQSDWAHAAQEQIDEHLDQEQLDQIRANAERQIEEMREKLAEILETARTATDDLDIDLPAIEIPEPEIDEDRQGQPLLSSAWSWCDQTRALKSRKAYENGGAP